MSLDERVQERLHTPTIEEPKGQYVARTEYDGTSGYIQTPGLAQPPAYNELLELFGYDIREVKIVGVINQSRWQVITKRPETDELAVTEPYETRWLTAYKFAIAPAATSGMDDLIKLINKKRVRPVEGLHGDGVFHFLTGDLQLGKIDGDGTEGIVNRYLASVEAGVKRYRQIARTQSVGLVHLAWLGDCGEGNQSQNGRNMWRTSLTITEQYRLFRRLALHTIDAFLPYAAEIQADTVNGNHDDVQRFQMTRMDDGHATEAMVALNDGLALNPATYGKVKVFVPNLDEGTLTRDIGGTVITHAHGHQWRKGNQFTWWSEQALNLQSPGASSFLLHGHTHEFDMKSKRDRTYICVPTFESESTYWRQLHGDVARTGAVTMVTRGIEWSNLNLD